jgi:hypothetical protein
MTFTQPNSSPFDTLRRFVRKRSDEQRCELCGNAVAAEHEHLVEIANRRLVCCCGACAILFSGRQNARYRRVPRSAALLDGFRLDDDVWDRLHIPINLAFFFHSTPAGRVVAMYPSPAGPTESLLPLEAWNDLVTANPVLSELEPDVEALLAKRLAPAPEYFRVPIDECYKLVGVIRTHWRGLSGGTEVWRHIGDFFDSLRQRDRSEHRRPHA